MKKQEKKLLQLTAKQRLAVTRLALVNVSSQTLWQGVAEIATKGIIRVLLRAVFASKDVKSVTD